MSILKGYLACCSSTLSGWQGRGVEKYFRALLDAKA